MIIVLDSGPLGLLSHPRGGVATRMCAAWLHAHVVAGTTFVIPAIVDYELRRELLRINSTSGIHRLDELCEQIEYEPLTTASLHRAAAFWAEARRRGQATTSDQRLDVDVILAAQAIEVAGRVSEPVVIATTNVRHLGLFARAERWDAITPA